MVHVRGGGSLIASFSGNRHSCLRPNCDGMANQQMSGTFEISSSGRWRLLSSVLHQPEATGEDYKRLYETLISAKQANAAPHEVAAAIRQAAPMFNPLGTLLVSDASLALATWLQLILTVLLYITSRDTPTPVTKSSVNVNVNVRQDKTYSEQDIANLIDKAVRNNEIERARGTKEP